MTVRRDPRLLFGPLSSVIFIAGVVGLARLVPEYSQVHQTVSEIGGAPLLWLAIALNLGTLDRQGSLWAYERPIYGLVQRSLFLAWFAWCAGAGWLMWRRPIANSLTNP